MKKKAPQTCVFGASCDSPYRALRTQELKTQKGQYPKDTADEPNTANFYYVATDSDNGVLLALGLVGVQVGVTLGQVAAAIAWLIMPVQDLLAGRVVVELANVKRHLGLAFPTNGEVLRPDALVIIVKLPILF